MKYLLSLFIVALLSIYVVACNSMGGHPEGAYLEKIMRSSQFNAVEKQFENPIDTPLMTGDGSTMEMFLDFFFEEDEGTPNEKLPEDPSSLAQLKTKAEEARFIWFGHSTILLELEGKRILFDPVFSNYASPIPGVISRFQPPVYGIDEIDNIDVVVISHDHYDHLDYESIDKLKVRDVSFLVPLGVGAHLRYWGVEENRIHELDWWEDVSIHNLKFTALPAQHFSGRGLLNGNSTLWASWAVKGKVQNIYFNGDSGFSEHYQQIGERLGPFDLAFLENGAYDLSWKFVHQLPEEGVQASIDLKSKVMVPIHWGMFDLALHSWYEPIQRVTQEAESRGVEIVASMLGEMVSTKMDYPKVPWWNPLIPSIRKD